MSDIGTTETGPEALERCLLLVDADLPIRHTLAEFLRGCGYKVIEAFDTDEAIIVLTESPVEIDIVLVDVNSLGRVNGFGLAKWVRENAPGTDVILAGSVERAAQEAGDLCEEGQIQPKPYDHQILADRIKRELARRDRARSRTDRKDGGGGAS